MPGQLFTSYFLEEGIPDHLLFGDAASKDRAAAKPAPQRYPDALAVSESKRFGLPLDARPGDVHFKSTFKY